MDVGTIKGEVQWNTYLYFLQRKFDSKGTKTNLNLDVNYMNISATANGNQIYMFHLHVCF